MNRQKCKTHSFSLSRLLIREKKREGVGGFRNGEVRTGSGLGMKVVMVEVKGLVNASD